MRSHSLPASPPASPPPGPVLPGRITAPPRAARPGGRYPALAPGPKGALERPSGASTGALAGGLWAGLRPLPGGRAAIPLNAGGLCGPCPQKEGT